MTPVTESSASVISAVGGSVGRRADVVTSRQDDFAAVLSRTGAGGAGAKAPDARDAAEQFVAVALVQPILKQLRDSNRTPPPFGPGEGEKLMGSLADAQVAQALVRRTRWPLVDRIRESIEARGRVTERAARTEVEA